MEISERWNVRVAFLFFFLVTISERFDTERSKSKSKFTGTHATVNGVTDVS